MPWTKRTRYSSLVSSSSTNSVSNFFSSSSSSSSNDDTVSVCFPADAFFSPESDPF